MSLGERFLRSAKAVLWESEAVVEEVTAPRGLEWLDTPELAGAELRGYRSGQESTQYFNYPPVTWCATPRCRHQYGQTSETASRVFHRVAISGAIGLVSLVGLPGNYATPQIGSVCRNGLTSFNVGKADPKTLGLMDLSWLTWRCDDYADDLKQAKDSHSDDNWTEGARSRHRKVLRSTARPHPLSHVSDTVRGVLKGEDWWESCLSQVERRWNRIDLEVQAFLSAQF